MLAATKSESSYSPDDDGINLSFGFFALWACVKAPGIENRKQVNIKNMDLLAIFNPRELSRKPKGQKKPKLRLLRRS